MIIVYIIKYLNIKININQKKGLKILLLTILCLVIAYIPKVIGNDEYKSDVENGHRPITLDQTLPIAAVVMFLGLILISVTKECESGTEKSSFLTNYA